MPKKKTKYETRVCKKHGSTKYILENRGAYRCTKCRSENVAARRQRVKVKLVEHFGNKCKICGYSRYIGSLAFHHIDPNTKEFGLSVRGLTRSYDAMLKEAEKCILVCQNCHNEIHGGLHPQYIVGD